MRAGEGSQSTNGRGEQSLLRERRTRRPDVRGGSVNSLGLGVLRRPARTCTSTCRSEGPRVLSSSHAYAPKPLA
jgi:hypothetical protein